MIQSAPTSLEYHMPSSSYDYNTYINLSLSRDHTSFASNITMKDALSGWTCLTLTPSYPSIRIALLSKPPESHGISPNFTHSIARKRDRSHKQKKKLISLTKPQKMLRSNPYISTLLTKSHSRKYPGSQALICCRERTLRR
jgi:hypothetical protein